MKNYDDENGVCQCPECVKARKTKPLPVRPESAGWVDCVGVDGKKHICQPQDETTKCGLKIARKKLGKTDRNRFSCYDCTY